MKTRLSDLSNCGIPAFTFAGFKFPKYVWTLPQGDFKKRIDSHVNACTGGYYHAPKPAHGVDRFSFGWRNPVDDILVSELLEIIREFPFNYEIKCTDGRKLSN